MFVSVLSPKKSRLHSARIIAVPTKVLTKYDQQAFLLKICRHHLIFMLLQCTRLFATNLTFPCDHQNLLGKYCVKFLFYACYGTSPVRQDLHLPRQRLYVVFVPKRMHDVGLQQLLQDEIGYEQ